MRTSGLLVFLAVLGVALAMANPSNKLENKGLFCSFCEDWVKELSDELAHGAGSDEEKANRACDKVCKKHKTMDKVCKKIVDTSLKVVVKALQNGEEPRVVCGLIDMC
uniref:Saposin B-type domain-containing protein n=1 Tax=Panagrellus redivivus TaxID=6233 RepID=A0A7E4WB51_PANRE